MAYQIEIVLNSKPRLRARYLKDRHELANRFWQERLLLREVHKWICGFADRRPRSLLLYAATRGEPNFLSESFSALLPSQLQCYLPVIKPDGMEFYSWTASQILKANRYGILEPDPTTTYRFEARPSALDLCVVPALAVDLNGVRLGYGKGFYDRWISLNPSVKTAAAVFSDFIVPKLPAEEHDVRVETIIYNGGTIAALP